jgi:hypothetical protein
MNREIRQPTSMGRPKGGPIIGIISHQKIEPFFCHHFLNVFPSLRIF